MSLPKLSVRPVSPISLDEEDFAREKRLFATRIRPFARQKVRFTPLFCPICPPSSPNTVAFSFPPSLSIDDRVHEREACSRRRQPSWSPSEQHEVPQERIHDRKASPKHRLEPTLDIRRARNASGVNGQKCQFAPPIFESIEGPKPKSPCADGAGASRARLGLTRPRTDRTRRRREPRDGQREPPGAGRCSHRRPRCHRRSHHRNRRSSLRQRRLLRPAHGRAG